MNKRSASQYLRQIRDPEVFLGSLEVRLATQRLEGKKVDEELYRFVVKRLGKEVGD